MNTNVTISNQARALAETRAREDGFESIEGYIHTLIREDKEAGFREWMRDRIEEGLASGDAGELTRSKLRRLVSDGIAKANPGE